MYMREAECLGCGRTGLFPAELRAPRLRCPHCLCTFQVTGPSSMHPIVRQRKWLGRLNPSRN